MNMNIQRNTQTATLDYCNPALVSRVLYLAFELSSKKWKLGFTTGLGQKPRLRSITAGDLSGLEKEIDRARRHFKLSEATPVKACYEAGREAFSLFRALQVRGVEVFIMDSSSIERPRRKDNKTDRLDATKLVRLLYRYHNGEPDACSVVRVPSPVDEDRRQLHREMDTLKADRTAISGRIKSLLMTQGIYWRPSVGRLDEEILERLRTLDGQPLQPGLRARLGRELQRWRVAGEELKALRRQRRDILRECPDDPAVQMVLTLTRLRAIGIESAWLLVMELLAWRDFKNRRQVGAMSGMTGVHHASGEVRRDLGVSRQANYRVRGLLIELAWLWVRYQPDSQLTLWYRQRFASGSKRLRKIGIVAVARRLMIALWRLVRTGELPVGAELKS